MGTEDVAAKVGEIAARFAAGENYRAIEVRLQVARLNEAGIPASVELIEAQLGHPIAEASRDELRGVIAGLNAVNRQAATGEKD